MMWNISLPNQNCIKNREQISVRRMQRLKRVKTVFWTQCVYKPMYYSRAIKNKMSESTHCKLTNKELICGSQMRHRPWSWPQRAFFKSQISLFSFKDKKKKIHEGVFYLFFCSCWFTISVFSCLCQMYKFSEPLGCVYVCVCACKRARVPYMFKTTHSFSAKAIRNE